MIRAKWSNSFQKRYSPGHMMTVFQWHKNHTFASFSFKQKMKFHFFRKNSPINWIPFLLFPKIFFQFRSYSLWNIKFKCFFIIFWLMKIFLLNFSNRIFYQDNILQYFNNCSLDQELYGFFCCYGWFLLHLT